MEITPKYTQSESKSLSSSYAYVPNVTGKSYSDAIGILGSYGLKYKASPSTSGSKDFKVVDQYPKAGKKISKGGTVYLYKK
jgi:stage V sporulation protein D (sporulation-specific penicillin-binding protein)